MPEETWFQITAPHFVAGLTVGRYGYVSSAAPIIGYLVGWHIEKVKELCKEKDFDLLEVPF